jgi:hypothetical protein
MRVNQAPQSICPRLWLGACVAPGASLDGTVAAFVNLRGSREYTQKYAWLFSHHLQHRSGSDLF